MAVPPLALEVDPYSFACDGPFLGVPHGWNVLTNLLFLAVGIAGLRRLARDHRLGDLRFLDWTGLQVSVAALTFGSGAYHLFLTPAGLALDRVAIAGIMAFVAAEACVVALGWRPHAGRTLLLLVGAEASVLAWVLGATSWVYGLLQGVGGLVVLVLFAWQRRRGRLPPGAARPMFAFLLLYGVAKVFELLDEPVCRLTGALGGHPLKHVLSAAALLALLRLLPVSARLRG